MDRSRRRLAAGLASCALAAFALPIAAQPPRPSPAASVSQVVGVTEIAITYSRPGVKGRTIWGGLVPWNEVWRTGANEATTFTTSTDIMVEGKPLPAGKYALFTIPRPDRWTIIVDRRFEQWGAYTRKEGDTALQVDVAPQAGPMVERFEIAIPEVSDNAATVELRWEKVRVPIHLTVDTPKVALAKAETELGADAKAGALTQWARWAYDQKVGTDQALAWVDRALAGEGAKSYWAHATRARLLARAGRAADARKAAGEALTLAAASTNEGEKADAPKLKEELAGWPS